ncbi:ABC transporter ATP-binding protein [Comamonadaceae bacterium G21597-S1]|nr:ABC transporter ATP-binding protein [Comamonadaceae bacterium G21597-S1]
MNPILSVEGLEVTFPGRKRWFRSPAKGLRAVAGVNLTLAAGEILGVVGESGSGKTTLARAILGLQQESGGRIALNGKEVTGLPIQRARIDRQDVQYMHQDAGASLDPWWSIGGALHEALVVHGVRDRAQRDERIDAMLGAVGLDPSVKRRFPHELSGGQLKRVALARIVMLKPKVVVLDEPTAGLDMSVQSLVLSLLLELRTRFDLSYILITHDLSVVRRVCDRAAVMYLGKIVEVQPAAELFSEPRHPYTRLLLSSIPSLDGARSSSTPLVAITGAVGAGAGCAFRPRCELAHAECDRSEPVLRRVGEGTVACHAMKVGFHPVAEIAIHPNELVVNG